MSKCTYVCTVSQGSISFQYVLVGNKIDCTERKVSNSEVEQVSASEGTGMPYFEISAKETVGIEEVCL